MLAQSAPISQEKSYTKLSNRGPIMQIFRCKHKTKVLFKKERKKKNGISQYWICSSNVHMGSCPVGDKGMCDPIRLFFFFFFLTSIEQIQECVCMAPGNGLYSFLPFSSFSHPSSLYFLWKFAITFRGEGNISGPSFISERAESLCAWVYDV